MTENKRYYRTNVNLEDNNHEPYYNIRDKKKEGNNVLFMIGGKYTSKEIVGLLNKQDKELENSKKQLKRVYNYFMDYLEDEISSESFSEMWDFVITDEKWD